MSSARRCAGLIELIMGCDVYDYDDEIHLEACIYPWVGLALQRRSDAPDMRTLKCRGGGDLPH